MDLIDHLIYTASTNLRGYGPLNSLAFQNPGAFSTQPFDVNSGSYLDNDRTAFIYFGDPGLIEQAVQKHWFDINYGPITDPTGNPNVFQPTHLPPYHMIFAYLVENTRIAQIVEKLIEMYQQDELLGIADHSTLNNQRAFQWIANTEDLFFKTAPPTRYSNIVSQVRPNMEANRRNAYYRMFGMELAFGSLNDSPVPFHKAKAANNQFIGLLEQFLSEVWQAYTNAKNTSGANTTDYQKLIDLVVKIRQMLMARRGSTGFLALAPYRLMNLSREEYASVVMMTWLYFMVAYNSPVVNFLGCQANTAAERLMNIGRKVGINAHRRSQALFDLANPMATILGQIEFGTFEAQIPITRTFWLQGAIESQTPSGQANSSTSQKAALSDLLTVVNNWELATGRKIKIAVDGISVQLRTPQPAKGGVLVASEN